jgi:transposase
LTNGSPALNRRCPHRRPAHLHTFANGLERDHAAVLSGLTLPYSSGAVEGKVGKIKFGKRFMFGRANLNLLRKTALWN